mmetsp:Transcript_37402/g.60869  ORF Transcript_37402/g.60869 Transcript_37402/m.60869 type:complete len:270 (+) Transcript_37402:627-1436(+)
MSVRSRLLRGDVARVASRRWNMCSPMGWTRRLNGHGERWKMSGWVVNTLDVTEGSCRPGSRQFCTVGGDQVSLYGWEGSTYNGIRILVKPDVSEMCQEFERQLVRDVEQWRKEGRNAVWLPLDVNEIALAKVAYDQGFRFHSAKGRTTVLVQWLPEDVPNKVPHFGFHQVGVGSLVMNDCNQILLVKERHATVDRWKMPGGLVDPGETLSQGAVREVVEETGVTCEFQSILGFWQRNLVSVVREYMYNLVCVCVNMSCNSRTRINQIYI